MYFVLFATVPMYIIVDSCLTLMTYTWIFMYLYCPINDASVFSPDVYCSCRLSSLTFININLEMEIRTHCHHIDRLISPITLFLFRIREVTIQSLHLIHVLASHLLTRRTHLA